MSSITSTFCGYTGEVFGCIDRSNNKMTLVFKGLLRALPLTPEVDCANCTKQIQELQLQYRPNLLVYSTLHVSTSGK